MKNLLQLILLLVALPVSYTALADTTRTEKNLNVSLGMGSIEEDVLVQDYLNGSVEEEQLVQKVEEVKSSARQLLIGMHSANDEFNQPRKSLLLAIKEKRN